MVTITPIYFSGFSDCEVDVEHIHAEDDHVPMREIEDRGHGLPGATDPTGFRYTVHECRQAGCRAQVTTRLRHKVRLTELKGLVIEHEDGRIQRYGDVPEDWRTDERRTIFS